MVCALAATASSRAAIPKMMRIWFMILFFVRLFVCFPFVPQILLWVGVMPGNALEARLRRHGGFHALVRRRHGRLGLGSEIGGKAEDVNADDERGSNRKRQIDEIRQDCADGDVLRFEGNVRVPGRLSGAAAGGVMVSAHYSRWPPSLSGHREEEAAGSSSWPQRRRAIFRQER